MIDIRLIDYSTEYLDYKDMLKEEGKNMALEDLMSLLEGFVAKHSQGHIDCKALAAVQQLGQAYNAYAKK